MSAVMDLRGSENVVLTSAALDLMNCFQDGCDDLVAQMAEDVARKRYARAGKTLDLIEVEAQDVRAAGTELLRLIRQQLASSGSPSPAAEGALREMDECLACKQH